MKYLISLFLTLTFLNASMLHDGIDYCIEDFYSKNGSFYYLRSDNNTWYSTTTDNQVVKIIPNFTFNSSTNECHPNASFILGMQETEYNFLLGLVGLIFGAVFMFFTIQIFSTVGGRK